MFADRAAVVIAFVILVKSPNFGLVGEVEVRGDVAAVLWEGI